LTEIRAFDAQWNAGNGQLKIELQLLSPKIDPHCRLH